MILGFSYGFPISRSTSPLDVSPSDVTGDAGHGAEVGTDGGCFGLVAALTLGTAAGAQGGAVDVTLWL